MLEYILFAIIYKTYKNNAGIYIMIHYYPSFTFIYYHHIYIITHLFFSIEFSEFTITKLKRMEQKKC